MYVPFTPIISITCKFSSMLTWNSIGINQNGIKNSFAKYNTTHKKQKNNQLFYAFYASYNMLTSDSIGINCESSPFVWCEELLHAVVVLQIGNLWGSMMAGILPLKAAGNSLAFGQEHINPGCVFCNESHRILTSLELLSTAMWTIPSFSLHFSKMASWMARCQFSPTSLFKREILSSETTFL